jgi:hypothetical protein
MITHLGTTTFTPQWGQSDTEASQEERSRRLSIFRVKLLREIEQDCTQIVEFCETWRSQQLYQDFAPTWDVFCVEVLRIEPAWVDKVCEGLRLLRAEGITGPIPADKALEKMVGEVEALQKHGGDHTSATYQADDSKVAQYGNSSRYHIARLKRDHPAIAEALARGEYPSVRAAAKAAGFVREPTPLDSLHRYWRKVSEADRLRFLAEMLTPAELGRIEEEDTREAIAIIPHSRLVMQPEGTPLQLMKVLCAALNNYLMDHASMALDDVMCALDWLTEAVDAAADESNRGRP